MNSHEIDTLKQLWRITRDLIENVKRLNLPETLVTEGDQICLEKAEKILWPETK